MQKGAGTVSSVDSEPMDTVAPVGRAGSRIHNLRRPFNRAEYNHLFGRILCGQRLLRTTGRRTWNSRRRLVQKGGGYVVCYRAVYAADILPSFHASVPFARQRTCLLAAKSCSDMLWPHLLQRSGACDYRLLFAAHLLPVYIPQPYHTAIALCPQAAVRQVMC